MSQWVEWSGSAQAVYAAGEAFKRAGSEWGHVVVVRGPSGCGRTGVVQQIYEWIAARQPDPRYWPAHVSDEPDWWRRRDVIAPTDFKTPPESLLPWLWWGLSGREACAVWAGRETLRAHGEALDRATQAADQATRQRIAVALDAAITIAGLVPGVGALGEAVKTATGVVDNLSTATTLPSRAREAFTSRQSRFDAALRANASRWFTTTPQVIDDMKDAARWAASVAAVVPIVVAVDDADGLDEISIAFLDSLARASSGGQVLLVLAVNTDHHPTHPDTMLTRYENADTDHNPELHWMLSNLASQHRVTTIDLPKFTTTEATLLARTLLAPLPHPHGGNLVAVVAAADGRPGRLATLLAHRSVRTGITMGGELPALQGLTPRSATLEAFHGLPEATRVALATASIAGPRMPTTWLSDEFADLAAVSGWITKTGHPDPEVLAFVSRSLYETAHSQVEKLLTHNEIAWTRQGLLKRLEPLTLPTDEPLQWPVEVTASILDTLLSAPGGTNDALPALVAAWLRLRREAGLDTAPRTLLEEIARASNGPLLTATAEALYDIGYATRAVDLFTTELARLDAKYPTTETGRDPRTWSALHNLAAATAALGHATPDAVRRNPLYERAVTHYIELLRLYETAHQRLPSTRFPDTATDLARLYKSIGDPIHVIPPAERAEAEYARVLGSEHPGTLAARSNLAGWRGEAGDVSSAAITMEKLLPVVERVLGPEHPDTLTARHNLAGWRGETGDAAGAADTLEKLLRIRERVLGPEHPDTLTGRHNLARWRGQAGDAAGAAEAFKALLPIREQVLGPEHPDTLAVRANLATWRGEAGDAAGAVEALKELLRIREQVLGPEHPGTLATRHNLAAYRGQAGDMAGAADALKDLLPIVTRVLGPEHPNTLATRHDSASFRGEAGDAAGAANAFAELLPIVVRVFGPDHSNTLATRHKLEEWRERADNPL